MQSFCVKVCLRLRNGAEDLRKEDVLNGLYAVDLLLDIFFPLSAAKFLDNGST